MGTVLNELIAHWKGKKHSKPTILVHETYNNITEIYETHYKDSTLIKPQFSINKFKLF